MPAARPVESGGVDSPLGATVARTVEGLILEGVWKPGSRLRQEEIAERLGVSRTPVREALLLLQARGLVAIHPNRGAVVRRVNRRECAETFLIRAQLEGFAAQLAAGLIAPSELEGLVDLNDELSRTAEFLIGAYGTPEADAPAMAEARTDWIELNDRFHDSVLRASRCQRLGDTLSYLLSALPRTLTWVSIERNITVLEIYCREHEATINALRERDPQRARAAAHDHVMRARELMLTWLDAADDDVLQ